MARGVKTGGRQKGSVNKVTKDLRDILKDFITKELASIDALLDSLDSKDRLDLMVKLIPYVLPRYNSIDRSLEVSEKKTFDANCFLERLTGAHITKHLGKHDSIEE